MKLDIRKRVTKSPDVRRQELMDAAVHIFKDKGISRTTVSDITESAGVAKGTFYLYFDSKEQLLGAIKERFVDEILAHATSDYERVGREDWWALVDSVIENWTDFMLERADMIQVIMQEPMTPESYRVFADCEARVDAMFASGIQAGIEAGAFKTGDPELISKLFHYALDGTLTHAILYGERIDRDRFVRAGKELVRKALAP
ncbi:MAG: TetR/AcrR family transcriptional regulator [Actinomycetota bacterium]